MSRKASLRLSETQAQKDSKDYRQCFRLNSKLRGHTCWNDSGRTPTVGEVIELLRESSRIGKLAHRDSVENYELEAPAVDPSRSQPGRMNQKLCWSVKEAGERCGVSYLALYRAACRGDLKNNKGFGRMMVSESELSRFTANVTEYLPRKRGKTCGARTATPEHDNDWRVRGDHGAY